MSREVTTRRTARKPGPEAGLYTYARAAPQERSRIHLRLSQGGEGLLLVNASRAFQLNPSAATMAWLVLEGRSDKEAIALLRRRYRVSLSSASQDFTTFRQQLEGLLGPEGACPIHDLDLEVTPPFGHIPEAPYRMDLALTYHCNCDCSHCYNARPRRYPELDTEHWKEILGRLRQIGVPHICFTGGEATLRRDLPQLVAHANSLGQITGLLSNGRRLSDPAYVNQLAQAGLEHVQVTLESCDPQTHDTMVGARGAWRQTVQGIRNSLARDLFVMTNTTLLAENAEHIADTIDFLAELGVPTVGCNALIYAGSGKTVGTGIPERELASILDIVRRKTEQNDQKLIWYTPTQYCHFDPVQMGLGVKGCTAAMYNMCVEPDGTVIPCQSFYRGLGNVLNDPWESIWNHELAIWLRERHYVPAACQQCALLRECGGGCPLSLPFQEPAAESSFLVEILPERPRARPQLDTEKVETSV